MRWGLIARSEDNRGLGVQTLAMYRNLHPDSTLLVIDPGSGFPAHPENYPDATLITLDNGLDEITVRAWLADLDVVVTVETFYDWRIIQWAREAQCRTVVHVNSEFLRPNEPTPDVQWWPTTWLAPAGATIIPVPVELRPFVEPPQASESVEFLFVEGRKALADRNGAESLVASLPRWSGDGRLTMFSQSNDYRLRGSFPATCSKGPINKWEMYTGKHVLIMPRRFGGLCLPVLEALSQGMAVMMTDCSPNTDWPIVPILSTPDRVVEMPCGAVQTHAVYPQSLAGCVQTLCADRVALEVYMSAARKWATANTWERLRPTYLKAIQNAA